MKARIDAKNLKNALKSVKPFMQRKAAAPILHSVRIHQIDPFTIGVQVYNADCRIYADYTIECCDTVDWDKGFDSIVDFKTLSDLIKPVKNDTITLDADGDNLTVTAGVLTTTVKADKNEDWPTEDTYGGKVQSELYGKFTYNGGKELAKCVSDDPCRPQMNGAFLDFGHDAMVACDGRVMLCRKMNSKVTFNYAFRDKCELSRPKQHGILLPKIVTTAIDGECSIEVRRMFKQFTEPATDKKPERKYWSTSGTFDRVTIECDKKNLKLDFQPVEGIYPNYLSIIPAYSDDAVVEVANVKEFRDALTAIAPVVPVGNSCMDLRVIENREVMSVHAKDADWNRAGRVPVKLKTAVNGQFCVGLNHSYLVNCLPADWSGRFWLQDETRTVTFQLGGDDFMLLMPMLIEDKGLSSDKLDLRKVSGNLSYNAGNAYPIVANIPDVPVKEQPKPTEPAKPIKAEEKPKAEETKEQPKAKVENTMLKQYRDLKKKHPDALLLFRCGDFYETYLADADIAAEVLGITLTKSSKVMDEDGKPISMAGFPYHALDQYLPRLIRAGHRVAICDQMEAPKPTAKRGVTAVVSPGNPTEEPKPTEAPEVSDEEIANSDTPAVDVSTLGNAGDVIVDNTTEDTPAAPISEETSDDDDEPAEEPAKPTMQVIMGGASTESAEQLEIKWGEFADGEDPIND